MSRINLSGTLERNALSFDASHEVLASADITAPSSTSSSQGSSSREPYRAPVDMVAVIDISGSMSSDLPLVKETLEFMVSKLRDKDQFGLVTFGSESKVELQLSKMDQLGKNYASKVSTWSWDTPFSVHSTNLWFTRL